MYPDKFDDCNLEQLKHWRTIILAAKQKAGEQSMDAKAALRKVESCIKNHSIN